MTDDVSIAIETSSRAGGVALGSGDEMLETLAFDASRGHATELVVRLDELLARHGLTARDARQVYVSAGPGSFTGLRVGITVARTLAQAVQGVACVAVPTALAVAENARDLAWEDLGVVMDAREGNVYGQFFARRQGRIVPAGPEMVLPSREFLLRAPRPLMLTGEGLAYHDLTGPGIEIAEASVRLPRADGVWRVGRRLAAAGRFTEYRRLLPIYTRKCQALRIWEERHRQG
jgi:tRNA threonylcarbamoyladenosine biosynthesis protein TsaB